MKLAEAYVLNQPFNNLYKLEEALSKGTIFRDLYEPYKYEKEGFVAKNKEEKLKIVIMSLMFYCVDLNLYLDTHPGDVTALTDYKRTVKELEKVVTYYNQNYRILEASAVNSDTYFCWANQSWPWEVNPNVEV